MIKNMPKLSEVDKRLVQSVINSIDWDQIAKFYRILNKKIGYEQVKIKGISRDEKVTPESVKEELNKVLEYIIENDLPEMTYGNWVIVWTNGEWEISQTIDSSDMEGEKEEIDIPIMESTLHVHFVPQSVTVKEEIDIPENFFEIDDSVLLEGRLKQCIEQEDYILAGKIRDVIEELNKRKK
jgi:hypothetical protein